MGPGRRPARRGPARSCPDLPADEEPPGRALALRAWLAAHRHDRDAERRALRRRSPSTRATARRANGSPSSSGKPAILARPRLCGPSIRSIDQTRKEYIRLLGSASPESHADELARLAGRLGRSFDAARWAALGGSGAPGRQAGLAILRRATPSPARSRRAARRSPTSSPIATTDLAPNAISSESGSSRSARGHAPIRRRCLGSAGLSFIQENGRRDGRLIPPVTASGGVGLLDYDGDGWLDVYLVQGGPFPPDPRTSRTGDRLFRNRGDGTFEDVSTASGIAAMPGGYGHGVAVGDFDNDGHPDLFVTRWRSYALYRNRGDGTFEDVTEQGRPGRRSRLADLGGFRRPRRRRRPRPLRLPLPEVGRAPRRGPAPIRRTRRSTAACRSTSRRSRTTSSATTAAGSST